MGEVRRGHHGELMRALRVAIAHVEGSLADHPEDRALVRALAHLWSAHDELELSWEEGALPSLGRTTTAAPRAAVAPVAIHRKDQPQRS
jgi:hypothetical protein